MCIVVGKWGGSVRWRIRELERSQKDTFSREKEGTIKGWAERFYRIQIKARLII